MKTESSAAARAGQRGSGSSRSTALRRPQRSHSEKTVARSSSVETSYSDLEIRFAEGASNLGKVKNRTLRWSDFLQGFSQPARTAETFDEFLRLTKEQQSHLKNVSGFILGGHSIDGRRRRVSIVERSYLSFDIEGEDFTPEQFEDLRSGRSPIAGYEFAGHTTRKHTDDAPRLRMMIPMTRAVTVEEYEPAARIFASKLDASMEIFDPVSFRPTQMMFRPTASRDTPYAFFHNRGELLDPDELLDEFRVLYGDPFDFKRLPCSRRHPPARAVSAKAEDPCEKEGVIGAFCRAFDVHAAIAEFLSETYIDPTDDGSAVRYTYAGGTSANGAVVYGDGRFIYSHHSHDPISGRLSNAWDMVRVQLFGDRDIAMPENTKPSNLPSFKAMMELALARTEVGAELVRANYDAEAMFGAEEDRPATSDELGASDAADEIGASTEEQGRETSWIDDLETYSGGKIIPNLPNITLIVRNDPRIACSFEFNAFKEQIVTRRPLLTTNVPLVPRLPVRDPVNGDHVTDSHATAVRMLLELPSGKGEVGWGLRVTDRDLNSAIDAAAKSRPFHPVRDYLNRSTWDGRPRVERLFIDYLGAEDNAYHRDAARLVLVAAVARAFEPGHKFDFVPILEGVQGKRKSTFIRVLAVDWFAPITASFNDAKSMIEQTAGAWICELPELSSLRRSEVEDAKAFVASEESVVRLSYDRRAQAFRRQCIFMGTTNREEYLVDDTGNRRWWPVSCSVADIDTDRLLAERDQIWAEAKLIYDEMRTAQPHGTLPLYLVGKASREIAVRTQQSREAQDIAPIWAGKIEQWLDTPIEAAELQEPDPWLEQRPDGRYVRATTCITEVWDSADLGDRHPTKLDLNNIANALRKIGWKKNPSPRKFRLYGKQALWHRPSSIEGDGSELV